MFLLKYFNFYNIKHNWRLVDEFVRKIPISSVHVMK